jgi:GntR family transcriptional regulator
MLQEIESMARNSVAHILDFGIRVPPQKIREDLRLAEGEMALHLLRVRERDGMKFGHYTSWTAGVKMPADPAIFENTPRLSYFRQQGLEVSHVTQMLSAVSADASVAAALDVVEGSPLLSLTRRSYQKTGAEAEQIMDFLEVLYNPEHFQYSMDLTLD